MKNTVLMVVLLTAVPCKVTSSKVTGVVDQVINVTLVLDDLALTVSENLLFEASVPFIKFIDDNSEHDSLLGITYMY